MNTHTNRIRRLVGSGLAPAVLAGLALTLGPVPGASAQRVIDLDEPVAHAGEVRHASYTLVSGSDEVRVESDGHHAQVHLNGRHVKSLNLDDDWTRFEIKNEEGEVVATVLRSGSGAGGLIVFAGDQPDGAWSWSTRGRARSGVAAPSGRADRDQLRAAVRALSTAKAERPKVMIGVTLTDPENEELLEELGFDPDRATLISRVIDGAPAAKAGIRSGDVVVRVNGFESGDLGTIRETLATKEPGDPLNVVVVRDGDQRQFTIKLEAYEPEVFEPFGVQPPAPPAAPRIWTPDERHASARARIAELSARMGQLATKLAHASGEKAERIEEEMEALGEQIGELAEELSEMQLEYRFFPGDSDIEVEILEGEEGQKRMVLVPRPGQRESLDARLDELSRRLDDDLARFDDRMDEMEERIDRKLDELVDELLRRMRERMDEE